MDIAPKSREIDTPAAGPRADAGAAGRRTDACAAGRVVLSGVSGAGKQLAAVCFEDMGWRVVDNLPPRLLLALMTPDDPSPLCVVCDVRAGREQIGDLLPALAALRQQGPAPVVLFLDASDEVLVRRFKETRRTHPLFLSAGGILPALQAERAVLEPVRLCADKILDTSKLAPADLRAELLDLFGQPEGRPDPGERRQPITVTICSFGFKHGLPLDADLVFDVRFLKNPHYVDALRPFDGRDAAVESYVFSDERTACFLDRLCDLVGWSLPHYVAEGKAYLTVAVGCTGGKHRSVVVAEKLARFLEERGYRALIQHRDVARR